MIHVLYIDCCIRGELSRTKRLGEAFFAELQRSGKYDIERLTLMDEPLVPFQNGFFRQRKNCLKRVRSIIRAFGMRISFSRRSGSSSRLRFGI